MTNIEGEERKEQAKKRGAGEKRGEQKIGMRGESGQRRWVLG